MSNKTTIKKLSFLLMEMGAGGIPTDDQRLNYRVAKEYIRSSVAFFLRRRMFEEKNNSDENYLGNTTSKEADIKFEEDRGFYYIDTIGESVDLGGMKSYIINPLNRNSRWSLTFVPITVQESFNIKNLPSIPNTILYYKEGNKLIFTNGDVSNLDKVILTQSNIIPNEDDDEIPSDIGNLVLQEAYKTAYPELVQERDLVNDGEPTTLRQ